MHECPDGARQEALSAALFCVGVAMCFFFLSNPIVHPSKFLLNRPKNLSFASRARAIMGKDKNFKDGLLLDIDKHFKVDPCIAFFKKDSFYG